MRLSCFADGPDVGSRCAFLDRLQVGFFFSLRSRPVKIKLFRCNDECIVQQIKL